MMVKIIVVGDSNAGKTTLVHKLVYGNIPDPIASTTLGVDFHIIPHTNPTHLWDTGNLEKFAYVNTQLYRNSDAILIVYDIANPVQACVNLSKWHAQLLNDCNTYSENKNVWAVRSKCDHIPAMPPEIVENYCKNHNMKHISVSAFSNLNIDLFKQQLVQVTSKKSSNIVLDSNTTQKINTCAICS